MSSVNPPNSPSFLPPSLKRTSSCEVESAPDKKYVRNEASAFLKNQMQELPLKENSLKLSEERVQVGANQFILPQEMNDKLEIALNRALPNPLQTFAHQPPIQAQDLLAKMENGSELSTEEWEAIFKIAQENSIPTLNCILDSCILRLVSLLEKHFTSDEDNTLAYLMTDLPTEEISGLSTPDRVILYRCSTLITRYGHLKSHLNLQFDNDEEDVEEARAKLFLNICRSCPNIMSIRVTCNEAESVEDVLDGLAIFYDDFLLSILPKLNQLVQLRLDIVSPVGDTLMNLIEIINSHPKKFEIISLRIFSNPLIGIENKYHEDLCLLQHLKIEKMKSLSLLIEGDNTFLNELPFLKRLPLHQISLVSPSGEYELFKENITELSTYPSLEELILVQLYQEGIEEFASPLNFKKITTRRFCKKNFN